MKQNITNRPEGNPSDGVGGPNTIITPAKRRITAFALAMALLLAGAGLGLPLQASAAGLVHKIDVGTVSDSVTVYRDYYYFNNNHNNPQYYGPEDTIVFTGTGACYLNLYDGATVTLQNLELKPPQFPAISIGSITKDTTLVLKGSNTLRGGVVTSTNSFYPGISVPEDTSLVITGDGSLNAYGATGAAGIGGTTVYGSCGKITIESGNVRAFGGGNAAGIGGGNESLGNTGGEVIVNGGALYAESENGYAIGARTGGTDAGSLVVNGGSVTLGNGGFGPPNTGSFHWNGGAVVIEGTAPPRIDRAAATAFSFQNGDVVMLEGSGLGEVSAARVDGVQVTDLEVVDDSALTFTTPPGMTGQETVTVFSPTRGTGSGVLDYTIPAPVLEVQESITEIPQGSSLTLAVTNTGDYNAPSYQWYRDGSQLTGEAGDKLTATESGVYKVAVTDESRIRESMEITLTAEGAPPPSGKPSVSTTKLTVTAGESTTFTVSLGEGADAAYSASISSDNPAKAEATPTSLGQSGTVTVEGKSVGNATVSIGYSGGSRNGQTDTVQVTVTDQPINQVQVDFDPQGGIPTPSPITVAVGSSYPALPTVTRDSHSFEGWYTSPSGGGRVREGDTVTNSTDHTLYAYWSADGGGTDPGDNRQLTMGALDDDTAVVGRQYEKTVSITYTGSHAITFTQSGDALPSGLYFDSGSGRISGTPQTEGAYHLTIRAEESGAASPLSASRSFTLTVTNTYTDPVLKLAQLDNDTVTVGEPYRKTLSVTYDGTDTLAYSATGLAPGLNINGTSGEISGTPTTEGRYTVHITVTDGTLTAQGSYTLTVNSSGGTPPPTTPSGGSTRGSSSGGSSTPDSRVAKTQLPASAFSWDGRTLTIDHDGITVLGLLSVQWDGQPLTRGTEYSVHEGSVIVRFGEDFMAAQAPGDHTIKVEFLNHTGETTVPVGETGLAEETAPPADNNTYNPNTGGDGAGSTGATDNPNTGGGRGVWPALLLGSLSGAALVRFRRGSRAANNNDG